MRYGAWIMLLLVALVAASLFAIDTPLRPGVGVASTALADDAEEPAKKPGGLPPLKVDRSAPLLLDDAPEKKPARKPLGPVADNGPCLCCHTNYETEELAVTHAHGNVGCMDCHGKCYAHRDDEDNVTPPDKMYWPERIDPACKECHEDHDAPAREVIARWKERCPKKTDPQTLVCTDCHFQHRLKFRTVWWNKKTGKLIVRKEGERILMRHDPKRDGQAEAPEDKSPEAVEEIQ